MLTNLLERLDHWFIHQTWGSSEGLERKMGEEESPSQLNTGIVFVLDFQGIFRQALGITDPRLVEVAEYFLGKGLSDLDLSDCALNLEQAIADVFLDNRVAVLNCQVELGQRKKEYEIRIFPASLETATAVVTEMHHMPDAAGRPVSAKLWKV
jgi:hypothetical protein